MLKVYGRADSSNSAKVYWLLDEIGLESERIDCGGRFGGNDQPAYLAMNPHGKVPTIVDGSLVMWESNAILRYIASQYRAVDLWPESPAGRAAIDKWMDWCATALNPQVIRLRRAIGEGEPVEAFAKPVFAAFTLLERHFADNDYLAGPSFSLADITIGLIIHRWTMLAIDKPDLPNVLACFERLKQRPPYVANIVNALR